MEKITAKEYRKRYAAKAPKKPGGRGHEARGWRVIGGDRIYFKSKAEANFARYLEYLKSRGEIAWWK